MKLDFLFPQQRQHSHYGTNASSPAAVVMMAGAVGTVASIQMFTDWNPLGRCVTFWSQLRRQESRLTCADGVEAGNKNYRDLHASSAEDRNSNYQSLVNAYYDLATVFYEWGWGPCFHFHTRFPFESFWEGTRRHEYQLAARLHVSSNNANNKKTPHVLDVGCGIGGPMRNIARFLSCQVTGITLNPYQVERGNELSRKDSKNMATSTKVVQGDFMALPFEKNTFDAAYAIEATCHAPDRVACYKQVYKVLKPGGRFALYEWCMTDKYDPTNATHLDLKKKIEEGNGLPDITTTKECYKAMQLAGFEMKESTDCCDCADDIADGSIPWMRPLQRSWNPLSQRFQFNWLGATVTNVAIKLMELVRIAPKGTVTTQKYLQEGGFALRDAGEAGIFTIAYCMVGQKPL